MRRWLVYIYLPAGNIKVTSPAVFLHRLNWRNVCSDVVRRSDCLLLQPSAGSLTARSNCISFLIAKTFLLPARTLPAFFPPEISQSLSHPIHRIQGKNQPVISRFLFEENDEQQVCLQVQTHWGLLWAPNEVQGDVADICPGIKTSSLVHISRCIRRPRDAFEFPDKPLACRRSTGGEASLQGYYNQLRVGWSLWTSAGCTAACFRHPPCALCLPSHFWLLGLVYLEDALCPSVVFFTVFR